MKNTKVTHQILNLACSLNVTDLDHTIQLLQEALRTKIEYEGEKYVYFSDNRMPYSVLIKEEDAHDYVYNEEPIIPILNDIEDYNTPEENVLLRRDASGNASKAKEAQQSILEQDAELDKHIY